MHNNLPLGRNMEELIRMVDALQFHEEHGEVCPANWQPGKVAMALTPEGVAAYLKEHAFALSEAFERGTEASGARDVEELLAIREELFAAERFSPWSGS